MIDIRFESAVPQKPLARCSQRNRGAGLESFRRNIFHLDGEIANGIREPVEVRIEAREAPVCVVRESDKRPEESEEEFPTYVDRKHMA